MTVSLHDTSQFNISNLVIQTISHFDIHVNYLIIYLFALTCHGFRIYALTFLVNGFNIFGSSFFTALNNGAVSAIISFLRTLVFQIAALLILPLILGIDGIWSAVLVSELITLILTTVFLIKKRTVYHY